MLAVVPRGLCFERAAAAEKMEALHEGNEISTIRSETLAPPPDTCMNHITQEEEEAGERATPGFHFLL